MDSRTDLRLVLRAVRAGLIAAADLAAAEADWNPAANPTFVSYLIERGLLSTEQVRHLETAPGEAAATPVLTPASEPETTDGTLTFDPNAVRAPLPAGAGPAPRVAGDRFVPDGWHRAGGLGEVWRVFDRRVGRRIALKSIRRDLVGRPQLTRRFLREARLTAHLEHPGIVPLYDVIADGADPAYTMRFVAGKTLHEATAAFHAARAAGAAPPTALADLLEAFTAVCRAVAYAHAQGVVHRDLKGHNVVLGDFGEVFVIDWGLAKRLGAADPEDADAGAGVETRVGSVVGTVGYIAPEGARGDATDRAGDVYGLGAVLYSILAGQHPYHGLSMDVFLDRVADTKPQPVPELNPAAPPALVAVAAKAMAADPAARYPTADALAADVRRWLADEPVGPYRDPASVRALRWARRHRTGVAAAAVFGVAAVLALSVGAALLWREQERTRAQKVIAEENFRTAFAASKGGFEVIEHLEPYLAGNQQAMAARKAALTAGVATFRESLRQTPDDPTLQVRAAAVFRMAANVHRFDGEFEAAYPLYADAAALLASAAADGSRSQVLRDRSQAHVFRGKLKMALADVDAARAIVAPMAATAKDGTDLQRYLATIDLDRAGILAGLGRRAEALTAAKAAAVAWNDLADMPWTSPAQTYDPLLCGAALTRIAAEYRRAGNVAAAMPLHRAAVGQYHMYLGRVSKTDPKRGEKATKFETFEYRRFEKLNPIDVFNFSAHAWYEQALTQIQDKPHAPAPPGALTAAITQWEGLVAAYPKAPSYLASLGNALVARADYAARLDAALLRPETAAQQKYDAEARADYTRAKAVCGMLIAVAPDVPAGHADLGRAEFGLWTLDGRKDPAALARAAAALGRAVELAPDRADDRADLNEVNKFLPK